MNPARTQRAGFTLIELMVVVGILGIVMLMGVPAIGRMVRKESLTTTVKDITEACLKARSIAILSGNMAEMRIRPLDRRIDVSGTALSAAKPISQPTGRYSKVDLDTANGPVHKPGQGVSVQIPASVEIAMVDVNFTEYKAANEVRVRFYPNGTCDELTLVLVGDNNQYRKISLELVTSLPDVERLNP